MKRKPSLVPLTILALIFSALPAGAEFAVTDMAGRAVALSKTPERIACLGPGALRLIVYLKAANRVVGVEDMEKRNPTGRPYWIASPELYNLPSIGPGGPAAINRKPDLEAVLAAAPEVLFITYMEAALADEVQGALDIPVIVLSYGADATFDETVFDSLRVAGTVLDAKPRAEAVVEYVQMLRTDLKKRTRDFPEAEKPSVWVGGIGHRGAHGLESTERDYFPLDWIRGRNLAREIESGFGSHVFADKEHLLKLNPDVIFIDGGGRQLVMEDIRKKPEFYGALRTFQKRRVHQLLPFNFYATNIGTAAADAYAIGKILYPEAFADVSPAQKADDIYAFLVGEPVYAEMAKAFGPIGAVPDFVE
jgi:iron complex transport system substrate-binding protein